MISRRKDLLGSGAEALAVSAVAYAGFRDMGSMGDYNASVGATRSALENAPDVRDLIRYATLAANSHNAQPWRFRAEAENEKCTRQIASSAGIAVFLAAKDDREHWVLAGRACQRFALQATALGLKHAFINQPVEVASMRPELAALIGLPGRRPDIVMGLGHGPALPFSARRPVGAVLA